MKLNAMKILTSLLFSLIAIIHMFGQAPEKFSFQSVVRNSANQLVSNQQIGVKISILQGSFTGSIIYSESHFSFSNSQGLVSLQIGTGSIITGNFSSINWSSGPFYIKSEVDIEGGSNYTIETNQQLISVPYALYSNDVPSSVSQSGDTLFIGSAFYIIPGISAANQIITLLPSDHSCGEPLVHNPNKTYGTLIDQEGNTYKTILIGSQKWMAENLKTSVYRNGDAILTLNPSQWSSATSGAWLYYNNDVSNQCPYGKIYNWYTVVDSRNVCPIGWHVPSLQEWYTLINTLGGEMVAGGKLKSTGLDHWSLFNEQATNESGFSSLPGGASSSDANTYFLGENAYFWTSSIVNAFVVSGIKMYSTDGSAGEIQNPRTEGMSIRCVED
jgi:uncharacterized protein (TIGR02145 family)